MEYLLIAIAALLTVVIALLIVLLVRQSKLNRDQEQQNHQFADYLKNFGYDVFDELVYILARMDKFFQAAAKLFPEYV